ncbi:MAG TPA: glycine betaine ABC transporter substrate-binding protein [Solirubrobacterales bacterium]|nr:glycine betaine ABC transporter substrate-binding protein [Solirubrobacterales bacterium]
MRGKSQTRAQPRPGAIVALLTALVFALAVAGCGDGGADNEGGGERRANLIEENADNNGVEITVGSKNFTEQYILGEIYAQALDAAGYDVSTHLNLGSEQVALRALEEGEIDAYPEYTSTALTSFFDFGPDEVPADPQQAFEESQDDFEKLGLVAYPPTPFSSANAVGLLTETADELGVSTISDLEGKSQDLTLYGAPECRQRIDCLVGLERDYGLEFKQFVPVDIARRYEVLDRDEADLSILFTTDAQLFVSDNYVILEDDKDVLPAGNVLFVARRQTADEAGPGFGNTIASVQENLTLEVMQELNARVDVDHEKPAEVARRYLVEFGYVR